MSTSPSPPIRPSLIPTGTIHRPHANHKHTAPQILQETLKEEHKEKNKDILIKQSPPRTKKEHLYIQAPDCQARAREAPAPEEDKTQNTQGLGYKVFCFYFRPKSVLGRTSAVRARGNE